MRAVFTRAEALAAGRTPGELRWGVARGRWQRAGYGVYAEGLDEVTSLDRATAAVLSTGGVACGGLAGVLLGLDSVNLDDGPHVTLPPGRGCRRADTMHRVLAADRIVTVDGMACTDGLQTLVDLAALLDDARWEQALEAGLRKGQVTILELVGAIPALGRARVPGTRRIRRVLANRPDGAPATESLLETLAVQLVRRSPRLGEPVRQLKVFDRHGRFVGRPDLSWPDPGLFLELDGQHHAGQPCYDARRETAIVAATGWLCGRFTWREITRLSKTSLRRIDELADQARSRPFIPQTGAS